MPEGSKSPKILGQALHFSSDNLKITRVLIIRFLCKKLTWKSQSKGIVKSLGVQGLQVNEKSWFHLVAYENKKNFFVRKFFSNEICIKIEQQYFYHFIDNFCIFLFLLRSLKNVLLNLPQVQYLLTSYFYIINKNLRIWTKANSSPTPPLDQMPTGLLFIELNKRALKVRRLLGDIESFVLFDWIDFVFWGIEVYFFFWCFCHTMFLWVCLEGCRSVQRLTKNRPFWVWLWYGNK